MSEVKVALKEHEQLFFDGHIACMLWSSNDNSDDTGGVPLNDIYGPDDVNPACLGSLREDCLDFIRANQADLTAAIRMPGYTWARAGHDFWLTRNGHGAGFWDRGLEEVGERLSEAARVYGGRDPVVGDDGMIYVS